MFTLLGIPSDENSSFLKGPAKAPPLIRKALYSESSNLWTETGIDLRSIEISDQGDISIESDQNFFKTIKKKTSHLLEKPDIPIILGGDHSITYPIISAFRDHYPQLSILHFDAHPDLYNELKGNKLSHACPFARIMENNLADHITQIGIRGMNGHQKEQAQRFGIRVIEMKDILNDIRLEFTTPLYISFDMDVLDPAFAPGVSHFEPGGLSTREAIRLIHLINAPQIVGFDIVEYNPDRDSSEVTAMACAKILKEIAGKIIKG